jgi:uncharacterized protein
MTTDLKIKEEVIIPPYSGRSVLVRAGEQLVVIDMDGKQVGDFVCFNYQDPNEFVSPVHMRACLSSIRLKEGDFLYSNIRRPLMKLVKDTVGRHDFFFPACDYWRYKVDFGKEDHPNCHDNLQEALRKFDLDQRPIPDPINLFMNNVLDENWDYVINEPWSKPGDYVQFEALHDVVVAVSTCSQDMAPVNGFKVTRLKLQVLGRR